MKKEEQKKINEICENLYNDSMQEFKSTLPCKKLRTCTAWVYESKNYYFLKSYNTIVAIIDKETDTLIDILRVVFGYTSTSAQHISKFDHDYCKENWGCKYRFTAR